MGVAADIMVGSWSSPMTIASTKMNADQFLMLGEDPPGVRLELVQGDIVVSPSPSFDHSYVDTQLRVLLAVHINEHDLGQLVGDVDTIFDRLNVLRPDLIFIAKNRLKLLNHEKHGIRFAPDLCVEILSPSSVDNDEDFKFKFYAQQGVRHYWIVNPADRTFRAYKLGKKGYAQTARGDNKDVVTAAPFPLLKIQLAQIWRP
jgi:Uma2 family endonuclease